MRQSSILGLLFGLITIDQVEAHRLNIDDMVMKRSRRPHHRQNIMTYYDSPFGLDSNHGSGDKKIETNIDLGMGSSDEDNGEQEDADFEPSAK